MDAFTLFRVVLFEHFVGDFPNDALTRIAHDTLDVGEGFMDAALENLPYGRSD